MGSAFQKAAHEMYHLDPEVQRVIIMMSDFRIDDYSASEAVTAAKLVVKEQPNTTFFTFGVGRFVDLNLVRSWSLQSLHQIICLHVVQTII